MDCETIVYDLHHADFEEVKEKLNVISAGPNEDPKTVILISSLQAWGNTPPKQVQEAPPKQEDPEEDPLEKEESQELQEEPQESEEPQEIQEPREPTPPKYITLPFEETDYQTRVAPEKYQAWKELEDLVLQIREKENLTCYVISSGLLYGNGENLLEQHLRMAWLESPTKLPYVSSGSNLLPTIHVKDLAKATKYISEAKPESPYIFAVDNTQDRQQKSIVKGISSGIGTGEIEQVETGWEELKLDLWLSTSAVLIAKSDEEEKTMPFEWHCIEGISEGIKKLNQEFNQARQLRPIRILITGPPYIGKTAYAEKLAQHYNVHLVTKKSAIEHFKSLGKHLEESDESIAEAVRTKLECNACRNRGYVLVGWPLSYEQAKLVFTQEAPPQEEEEETEEPPKTYTVREQIIPHSVVILRASDEFIAQRVQSEGVAEKLDLYRSFISKTLILDDFFAENNIDPFEQECGSEELEIIENLKIYIERNGRPYNYLASTEEIEETRRAVLNERIQQEVTQQQNEASVKSQQIQQQKLQEEQAAYELLQQLKAHSELFQEANSLSLRQYLMEYVMPYLAEGMLEVCRALPSDPVDYLAEFLWEQSNSQK